MRRSWFSDEQIFGILKDHEAEGERGALCQRHGISEYTYYRWKHRYSGLEVNGPKRLKIVEKDKDWPRATLCPGCPVRSPRPSPTPRATARP